MTVKEKINAFALAQDFIVEKYNTTTWKVEFKDDDAVWSNLVAFIEADTNKIQYYVSGVYDSGCEYAEIDLSCLEKLKSFCEYLVKDNL